MLPFHHGVRSKRSHGSLTGPEERANVEHPFVIEHLERAVDFNSGR